MSASPKQTVNQERLYKVILKPHVSEKATRIADKHRQYVFQVLPDANKLEIKKAVEFLFNVEVTGVQVGNVKGKQKRFGQRLGQRAGIKKAYVTLKQGQDIDFMGIE